MSPEDPLGYTVPCCLVRTEMVITALPGQSSDLLCEASVVIVQAVQYPSTVICLFCPPRDTVKLVSVPFCKFKIRNREIEQLTQDYLVNRASLVLLLLLLSHFNRVQLCANP